MTMHGGDTVFKVVQLSDCHLAASAQTLYRGQSADAGLRSLLPAIAGWRPDLLLLSGDLSEDASAASYRRLAEQLQTLAVPVCALPGNHDDAAVMRRYFPDGPWNGTLYRQMGSWALVVLRSAVAGRIGGLVDAADIAAARKWIAAQAGRPVLLALHHQVLPAGSPWIDRYPLENPQDLLQLIESCAQIRCVVWGHVHQASGHTLGQARLLGCPSSAANSLAATEAFRLDPAGPACRWLRLFARGDVETGLLYAASAGG